MALRGQTPEEITKRLKMFLFGGEGVGKTTAAIQFPQAYIIDGEKGTENYASTIKAAGSKVFRPIDFQDMLKEIRALMSERHHYRTLVIDPITTLWNDLLEYWEKKVGDAHGRHYGKANTEMARLGNLLKNLDMNVVMTSHGKKEYAGNNELLGMTYDAWKGSGYFFDLVIELGRDKEFSAKPTRAKGRWARVIKTRIDAFPDGDVFQWSYAAVCERYDKTVLERESATAPAASGDQVRRMAELLKLVKLGDQPQRWLNAAKVERWEDMPGYAIQKCIEHVEGKIPGRPQTPPAAPGANGNGKQLQPAGYVPGVDDPEDEERQAIQGEPNGN